ncbi:MAG: acyl-[acyl-carrier-protein]--UDP-N-acetylglucosamine O-acyltransferase, partial [Aquificaceae bacterium]
TIGLERRGFSKDVISLLKKAYRLLFRSNMLKSEAIEFLLKEYGDYQEIRNMVAFIQSSKRGVARDAGKG